MKKHVLQTNFFKRLLLIFTFTAMACAAFAQSPFISSTPGTANWTVPYGVTSITVETWGAGGAGGGSTGNGAGGGGGGGGYNTTTISGLTYGTIFSYTVGAGSTGSTGAGVAGSSTSFNSGTIATGGNGGGAGAASTYGAGGTGGTGSNTGGTGATATSGGGGGGGGGSAGNGSNGGIGAVNAGGTAGTAGSGTAGAAGGAGASGNANGTAGTIPGGGGGGGKSSGKSGGKGADGQVKITYTVTCTAPPAQPTSMVLSSVSTASIAGSFTAASYTDGYLVVMTTTASAPTNPTNGTTYVAGAAGLGGTIIYFGALTTFTASSLTTHQQYWFWVYGFNNSACTGGITYLTTSPLSANGYTLCATPGNSPTLLTFPTVTYNSISGSYTAAGSVDGYLVIQMTSNTTVTLPTNGTTYTVGTSALGGTVVQAGAGTTFTASGLSANTQYWYTIFSMNFTTCYGPVYKTATPLKANTTTALAPCVAPTAQPTSLVLTGASSTSIGGSFTAEPSAYGYLVVRTTTSSAPTNPVDGTTYTAGASALGGVIVYTGTSTSFTSSGLTANTPYWYWIYSYNDVTCASGPKYYTTSPLSDVGYTACVAPSAQPTALTVTPYPTSIVGSFHASLSADGYLVIRMTSNTVPTSPTNGTVYTQGASALGGTVAYVGPLADFTDTGLSSSTQYWYTIFAYNNNTCLTIAYKTGAPLKANTTTLAAYCVAPSAQPTSLTLTPAATSIAGSFTASGSANGYLVVYTNTSTAPTSPVDGLTYTAGQVALGGTIVSSVAGTTFTASGLSGYTQYWFWVFAYNNTGCTGGPKYYTVSPLSNNSYTACVAPTQPTSLSLTPTPTTIAGSFTPSVNADAYLVVRMTSSTNPTNPTNGTTYTAGSSALGGYIESAGIATSFTSTGLSNSTGYWYTIFAYDYNSCTTVAYQTTTPLKANTTTLAAPCVAPTAQPTTLVLTPAATSIAGSFTASGSADGYLVVRTTTSSAPTNPTDVTTYTAGASALGGVIVYSGSSNSFSSTGLTAHQQYWYWVYSYNNSCSGGPLYYTVSPLTGNSYTTCAAPTAQATAGVVTPSSYTIAGSFTASGSADSYLVIRMTSSATVTLPTNGTTYTVGSGALGGIVDMAGPGTSWTSTGLSASTGYWYTIFAYNASTCVTPAYYTASPLKKNTTTLTPPCVAPPAQPTSLVLTPAATSIAGSFTADPNTENYLVVRTTTSSAPTSPTDGTAYTAGTSALGGVIVYSGALTTFTASSLSANTQYWFWVYGYNSNCTGTKYLSTSPLSGNSYTACSAPAAQATSLVLTPSTNSISASFTGTTASGYLVIRMSSASAPSTPVTGTVYTAGTSALGGYVELAGSSTSFTSTSLTANTQYWYTVYSYNNTSCANIAYRTATPLTNNTTTSMAACATPAAQPTALVFTPAATAIAGAFTAASGTDGYLVVRTLTSSAPTNPVDGTTYTVGASSLGGLIISAGATVSFNSTSLSANTQYWYWIYSYNNVCTGTIKYLSTSPLTGSSYTTCTAPTAQPTVLTLTPSSYSIAGSFTASASAQSYLVIRMTTSATVTLPTNGTTYTVGQSALGGIVDMAGAGTSWTSSGLSSTTQYWYTIFAYNNNTCSTVAYYTATPLKGNTTTLTVPCTAPAAQPTSLVAGTTYSESLSASFTATTADGYLVVRTATSSAPTTPVTGTVYTAGTSALGGYIESAGTATSFTSTSLTAGTTYWYWVYAYNKTACANIAYKTASPLTASITTAAVGTWTNTCTITTGGTATYNYSTLTWGLGHSPTSSEIAEIVLNISSGADDVISINLDLPISVYGWKMRNISSAPTVHILQTNGSSQMTVANDMYLSCTAGNKWDRCVFANIDTTIISGNLILGSTTPGATEGHSAIGSTGSTANQTYIMYGDMTFNKKGYTTDEHARFVFDKAGTQHVYNNTTITDTIQPVLFETLIIGSNNATTLIFGGTQYDSYIENVRAGGVTIGVNSTLDLPGYCNMNKFSGGYAEPFTMLSGAKLRLGGDKGVDVSGATVGVTGSNFPANFNTYPFNANSTVEYYGGNSITQTIYNTPTYGKLVINNGSGSGRAAKITTGPITASTSIDINALADVTLGSTVSSAGPFNVNATGGLYCATNTVSGAGAFTLASTGYLGLGSPQGITSGSTASGNIQMTGGRSFSTGGNYIYNGTATQVTGNGLPTTCNDLTIDNPTTVTIANSQNVSGVNSLKQGTFDIGTNNKIKITGTGTLTSTGGLMKANLGMLELAGSSGSAQSIDGSWFVGKNISTLINSNTTGITLAATANDTLLISSALLYGSGTTNSTITTNNNLTLLSRDSSTARFGEIVTGSGNTITGNVNVERWVRSGRKWRLLAWPTTSTQTARQAWMENNSTANGNTIPGYGVIVTDEKATWSTNNFDSRSVSGPSVKYYDPATATFIGIPNTTSYQMNSQSAYYNYVRGDRSCLPSPATVSTTNLRTTGTLKTGNQVFSIPVGKYAAIGNPYASAVDVRSIDTTNTTQVFYLWDPLLTGTWGLGAYQTLYVSGAGYKILPGGGSYPALNTFVDTLESGSGFFVKAKSTGAAATVTFKESAKTIGLRTQNRITTNLPTISTLLSIVNGGVVTLADGAMAMFDAMYSNSVDDDDNTKMTNTGENVSFKRNGVLLGIERRQNIVSNDTLFLNISGTTTHLYQWDITSEYLADPQRTAFLRDNYLGTDTPLNLSGVTSVQFNTNNTPGTYAANRFMIIFQQAAVVPVRFTTISAARNSDKTVTVKWNTENEINMQQYKIEQSNDGVRFTEIGGQQPTANNGGSAGYSFIDAHATSATNYYRIKGISLNGQIQYTAIVKVGPLTATASTDIYPNPVINGEINLRLVNQPKGNYKLKITDKIGRVLHTETLQVNSDNMVRTIHPGTKPAAGSYQLSLADESGKISTIPFIIQ